MYNLGYMYQLRQQWGEIVFLVKKYIRFGEGVPAPDPHLAKRYFDLSLATNPASLYAVFLSLLYLHATTSPLSSVFEYVNVWFWYNEAVVISILTIVLITLLSARLARQD